MSDYKPFTDATRLSLRQWAENTILRGTVQSEKNRAWDYLRYEGTIQAKDATIAALVKAGRTFSDAHGYTSNGLEAPDATVDPQDWAEFDAAIKEATE